MQRIFFLEGKLRLRLITSEFEILAWLYFNGPTRSRELCGKTKASVANFQIILRRMREEGVIVPCIDAQDRRARAYDLAPGVRADLALLYDSDPDSRAVLRAIAEQENPYADSARRRGAARKSVAGRAGETA